MRRKRIIIELKKIIEEVIGYYILIDENTNLRSDLGMDSFSAIEMLVLLEKKFDITINPTDVVQLETLKDVVVYIQEYF